MKYHRVKCGYEKSIMPGNEISVLQRSGCSVKILRKATKEEYEEQEAVKEGDECECHICHNIFSARKDEDRDIESERCSTCESAEIEHSCWERDNFEARG